MQQAAMLDHNPFTDAPFGSRAFRTEIQWNPTKEELTAQALQLTEEQRQALTWEEAWGLIMPNDDMELGGFQWRQQSGKFTPWEAVVSVRNMELLLAEALLAVSQKLAVQDPPIALIEAP